MQRLELYRKIGMKLLILEKDSFPSLCGQSRLILVIYVNGNTWNPTKMICCLSWSNLTCSDHCLHSDDELWSHRAKYILNFGFERLHILELDSHLLRTNVLCTNPIHLLAVVFHETHQKFKYRVISSAQNLFFSCLFFQNHLTNWDTFMLKRDFASLIWVSVRYSILQ